MEALPVRIEHPRPEDAREICEVSLQSALDTFQNPELGITRQEIERAFQVSDERVEEFANLLQRTSAERFVAREGNRIVATVRAQVLDKRNRLSALYVLPSHKRRGLGTMVWRKIQKTLDPQKDTFLYVVAYNKDAIAFYKSLGFADSGKEDVPDGTGLNRPMRELVRPAEYQEG